MDKYKKNNQAGMIAKQAPKMKRITSKGTKIPWGKEQD
jgi:hypothetical protein